MGVRVRVWSRTGGIKITGFGVGWIEAINTGFGSVQFGRSIIESNNIWFGFGLDKIKTGFGLGVDWIKSKQGLRRIRRENIGLKAY